MNDSIKMLTKLFIGMLLVLIVRSTYLGILQPEFNADINNTRPSLDKLRIPRGSIFSADGHILAESKKDGRIYKRVYPLGSKASHLVGFDSIRLGRYGAENYFNNYLSGMVETHLPARFATQFFNRQMFSSDITLTINTELQKAAAASLAGRRGAVVAINPKDGSVLAAYSNPTFDPENVEDTWDELLKSDSDPLLFRATQGLYPPGSLMKVITLSSALKANISKDSMWPGPSSITISGGKVTNYREHSSGEMTLGNALVKSSNTVFGQVGVKVGKESFFNEASQFGFGVKPSFDFITAKSKLPAEDIDDLELAWSAVGQGRVLSTPLERALMVSAVANKGNIQTPHLLKEVRQFNGILIKKFSNKVWQNPLNERQADTIKDIMVEVVEEGTGTAARIGGVKVAGKTGTAEMGKNIKPHAWFAGFAPADNPTIAVAVIIENGGLGGKVAAPVARDIIQKAINLKIN